MATAATDTLPAASGAEMEFAKSKGKCVTRQWTELCPGSETRYRSCKLTVKCEIKCSGICPANTGAGLAGAVDGGFRSRRATGGLRNWLEVLGLQRV